MSKPVNPMAIGGFTLGALALLVAGLLIFGGANLLNAKKARFVVFFDSSLNGLEKGAPVKMQGVKIGTVTDIKLEFESKTARIFKPVVVEIDRDSFASSDGEPDELSADPKDQKLSVDRLVKEGFRARLEMQSLLTGLLDVNFAAYPDRPAQFTGLQYQGLIELPSIPATTDELRVTAEEMAEKLRTVPLDKIVANFIATLDEIRNLLGSDEMKRSNVALAKTLEGMDRTIATLNQNLEPILKESKMTVTHANALMQDSRSMVDDVHREVKPVLASVEKLVADADKTLAGADKATAAAAIALDTATAALNKAQSTLATVDGAVGPDSTLKEALFSIRDAARSLKNLTDYLERHPESLISGKDH